jgi:cell wall-associated NlpC family hydrolase
MIHGACAPSEEPPDAFNTPIRVRRPRAGSMMAASRRRLRALACAAGVMLAACATAPPGGAPTSPPTRTLAAGSGDDVVFVALSLVDTGYTFGGKNPQAGLDCSGMVSYVYAQAVGMRLTGSAAEIGRGGRSVERGSLSGGDLVFFNTRGSRHSHVGIYVGDGRFVHAPSSAGRLRLDRLDNPYFAPRYEGARRYIDAGAAAASPHRE